MVKFSFFAGLDFVVSSHRRVMTMNDETMEISKYLRALEKAVEEAPLRREDTVEISDLWIITSLPTDLIVECVKNEEFVLPSYVKKVMYGKRVIVRNKNYDASQKKKD